tara:strand:- start:4770 stop:5351 length:582 start_codon:yes stop_codon:yes gene_type:complete
MITKKYLLEKAQEQAEDILLAIEHHQTIQPIVFRKLSPKALAMDDARSLELYKKIEKYTGGAPSVYKFSFSRGYNLTESAIALQKEVNSKQTTPRLKKDWTNEKPIYIGSSLHMGDRAIRHIRENGIRKGRGANAVLSLGAPHKGTCLRMNKWVDGLVDLMILPMPGVKKWGINYIEEICKDKYGTMFGRKEN